MNRTLWLCVSFLLLMGIVVFRCSQSYAVVPYTPIEGPDIKSQVINELNNKFVEKLQKHEEQNIQTFDEIKNELMRIKE